MVSQSVDLERHTSHSLMCALAGGSQHRRAVVGCKRRREELPRFIPSRGLQLRGRKRQSGLCHVVFVFRMRFMEMGVLCKAYKSNLQHPNTLQSRAHRDSHAKWCHERSAVLNQLAPTVVSQRQLSREGISRAVFDC